MHIRVVLGPFTPLHPLLPTPISHIDRRILARHPIAKKLLEQTRPTCRTKNHSPRTEESYTRCIGRFLGFHREAAEQWIHPCKMPAEHVESFLTHSAVRRRGAAPTQNQALNAIMFLLRDFSGVQIGATTRCVVNTPPPTAG